MSDATKISPEVMKLFDRYVHGGISRRQFLDKATAFAVSGVTAASMLAALNPDYALAEQVAASDPSISVGYKKYASPQGAGVMQGYFARPAVHGHKLPGVVVIHENRGLNPYIEDVARRLAVAGYIAFAPDALTPLGGYPGTDDEGRALQKQRDKGEMIEDFVAAVEFLRQHPDCNGAVGSVGFCFGGEVSLQLAVRDDDLNAAVAFYGVHPNAEETAKISAPLMLHHAATDERVNATWPDFEKNLQANEIEYANNFYPDVSHGFHNDTTPRYDDAAATLAWQRTLEFFAENLNTGG